MSGEEVDFEEEMDEQPTKAAISSTSAASKVDGGKGGRTKEVKVKGRGHERVDDDDDRYDGRGGVFERIEQSAGPGPLQCKLE